MKITDQMITAAVSAMAKADITFANCDAGWQKNAMRAALSSALHPHQEGEKESSTPAPSQLSRVPQGYMLVPIKPTKEMAYQAACHFYGKRVVDEAGGIHGLVMQARNGDPSFWTAFKKFWRASLANAPQPSASSEGQP